MSLSFCQLSPALYPFRTWSEGTFLQYMTRTEAIDCLVMMELLGLFPKPKRTVLMLVMIRMIRRTMRTIKIWLSWSRDMRLFLSFRKSWNSSLSAVLYFRLVLNRSSGIRSSVCHLLLEDRCNWGIYAWS